ncbi:MAG: outer membrane lipoprotein-sorting protein [Pyrinomonadaceae bacterium]
MSKVFRYAIFSFVFAAIVASAAVVEANAQLSEVLRRLEIHNQALGSVQANVTMSKFNPQLSTTDVYVGSTSYLTKKSAGKMYMRLDWSKPTVEHISVIGDDYELYKPSISRVYRGKTNKAKNSSSAGNALAFMNMSRDELRKNYTVTLINEESLKDGTPTAHLLLTPKAATSYKTSELWVDKDGMPRQAKITEANDDTTTVFLEVTAKNTKINTDIFKLKYDSKKVQIVKG